MPLVIAKKQIINWIKLNPTVQSAGFAITILYYGFLAVIGIGLVIFSVRYGNYTIVFVSVLPVLFLLFSFFWSSRKHATYADQLSIILLFLIFSAVIVPLGMSWMF